MKRTIFRPFFYSLGLTLILAPAGCAGGGSGGREAGALYREDLGQIMAQPLIRARIKIWGKYNIPLYREETTSRGFTYESEWIPRAPTLDETAATVTAGRNRVFMRGRQMGENMDGTYIYRVSFEVENQIQTTEFPDWHPGPMPRETRDEFRRVYSELQMELRAGVRR